MTLVVPSDGGVSFQAGDDTARLIISGSETGGRYALLEWTVAPTCGDAGPGDDPDYGPHLHRRCEETFLIQEGSLEFLVGENVRTLQAGDFVRVPPGIKHGYRNVSGAPVRMLVSFVPAGLEELFLRYRTDQAEVRGSGFVADATRFHASEFGLPNP